MTTPRQQLPHLSRRVRTAGGHEFGPLIPRQIGGVLYYGDPSSPMIWDRQGRCQDRPHNPLFDLVLRG